MGLGPRSMRDHDTIFVLEGCDFPVVMSPDELSWKVVGVCYIAGLIHGQFVEEGDFRDYRQSRGIINEEFEIC